VHFVITRRPQVSITFSVLLISLPRTEKNQSCQCCRTAHSHSILRAHQISRTVTTFHVDNQVLHQLFVAWYSNTFPAGSKGGGGQRDSCCCLTVYLCLPSYKRLDTTKSLAACYVSDKSSNFTKLSVRRRQSLTIVPNTS
jgi:hypothetical protein